jgi:murein DD-endopeptidase MepM/ murein hydrolase activator NlpD
MHIEWRRGRRILAFVVLLATTSWLWAQTESSDTESTLGVALPMGSETAQRFGKQDPLLLQLEQAHIASGVGDMQTAQRLFGKVQAAAFPWHAWAATSGLVAAYRMSGDTLSAFEITTQVSEERPHLRGLMSIWDGDTAVLAGDVSAAQSYYSRATQDTTPGIAELALHQLARLAILEGEPRRAARLKREILRRYPYRVSPEWILAEAMTFDAMASGQFPTLPLSVFLHRNSCTAESPCLLIGPGHASGGGESLELAGIPGLRFLPSKEDMALLKAAEEAAQSSELMSSDVLHAVCTPSIASDGFVLPLAEFEVSHGVSSSPGVHPGLDLHPSGECGRDREVRFVAVARGCVQDASPASWASATIEHHALPDRWISQYGHAASIYYSVGAAISRGAILGRIGEAAPRAHGDSQRCHLHHELREADHPDSYYADYYSPQSKDRIADWYQDPLSFYKVHQSYAFAFWADEGAFTRHGDWSYVHGPGNRDDMRWAWTTRFDAKRNYAQLPFVPKSSGLHELWISVPAGHATSSRAQYRVLNASNRASLFTGELDQREASDSWVLLGTIPLAAGVRYLVEAATNTGEVGGQVGLDDILLIRR